MWSGHECQDVKYPWPHVFSELAAEYERRYGLKSEHLWRIAEINFGNARRNPNAQTRRWQFTAESFSADEDLDDGRSESRKPVSKSGDQLDWRPVK